ncbi:MAG: glycosyltransferase family 2 protein [Cyanobium sp.]
MGEINSGEIQYSLVVPLYNEEAGITELYSRLKAVMETLDGPSELILVNDGSQDRTLEMIRQLHQQHSTVCYLSLARNFGHQLAVTAGLNFARGRAVIVLDGDLQDPPELISEMIDKWRQGYQVVYAQRIKRHQESWFKRFAAYASYRIIKYLADIDIPTDTGDFCLMDRKVVDVINSMPERNRYIRGLRAWVGFNQTAVRFERDPRFAGEVKYTFKKLLRLAMDGMFSFSKLPLRLSTYLGLSSALLALFMSCLVVYWRLYYPDSPLRGFATVMIVIFFLGSIQLITIGILGEYVGRIYEEVKSRPLYTLSEVGRHEVSQ